MHRRDRNLVLTSKLDGGGCIIAVKKKYHSNRITDWESENDDLWISIDLKSNANLILNARYIPCRCPTIKFNEHMAAISNTVNVSKPNAHYLLLGDYNLADSIEWSVDSDGCCVASECDGANADALLDMLSLTSMHQFNSVENHLKRSLDLVLSNIEPNKIDLSRSLDSIAPIDRHHPPLLIEVDVEPLAFLEENRLPKYNFFRANYDELANLLNAIN